MHSRFFAPGLSAGYMPATGTVEFHNSEFYNGANARIVVEISEGIRQFS